MEEDQPKISWISYLWWKARLVVATLDRPQLNKGSDSMKYYCIHPNQLIQQFYSRRKRMMYRQLLQLICAYFKHAFVSSITALKNNSHWKRASIRDMCKLWHQIFKTFYVRTTTQRVAFDLHVKCFQNKVSWETFTLIRDPCKPPPIRLWNCGVAQVHKFMMQQFQAAFCDPGRNQFLQEISLK